MSDGTEQLVDIAGKKHCSLPGGSQIPSSKAVPQVLFTNSLDKIVWNSLAETVAVSVMG
jgi:hypothetical protein